MIILGIAELYFAWLELQMATVIKDEDAVAAAQQKVQELQKLLNLNPVNVRIT